MSIEYHVGKRLVWVPHHADSYGHQRVVEVMELHRSNCAKLDNGWIVDEFGDCVKRDMDKTGTVITASFQPPGFVDDCL